MLIRSVTACQRSSEPWALSGTINIYFFSVFNFVSEHKTLNLEEHDSLWKNLCISVQHNVQSCRQASEGTRQEHVTNGCHSTIRNASPHKHIC